MILIFVISPYLSANFLSDKNQLLWPSIVMDDVLTTVDAGHRLFVARLLAREFPDYQFVITTHDKLWAKELETNTCRGDHRKI